MVSGHNLCWGLHNPPFLFNLTSSAKRASLVNHVKTVVGRYGTQAYAWDVVNEAVTDNPLERDPLKKSVWYPSVPDYLEVAFRTARATAGPQVTQAMVLDSLVNW